MSTLQDGDIGGSLDRTGHSDSCSTRLPRNGRPWADIQAELVERKKGDCDWRAGRLPLYIYYDNEELLAVSREAHNLYFTENALGQRAFPSLALMEAEIVSTALELFRAPEGEGSFTSGGTESLFLVLKAARERFRTVLGESERAQVVVPRTAHPAFDKAAQYLGMEVVRIDVGSDLRVDVLKMREAITHRTALIAGSAPCYAYGVFDDIQQLGELAIAHRVWLHVDACMGGFLAPFAREEGFAIPEFDFSVPGVTSLSADLHKHGFAARGASLILYRTPGFKGYQTFHFDDWPRGHYATDTFLGSRSGGVVASAWAVLQYLGHDGYRRLARKTLSSRQRLVAGIDRISGLKVLQPTELNILLYESIDKAVDINAVAEEMRSRGWYVGGSRDPVGIHLALNPVHAQITEAYLHDLEHVVTIVRCSGKVGTYDSRSY